MALLRLTVTQTKQSAGAYSQKGKTANLKEFNEVFNCLQTNGIFTLDDLEARTAAVSSTVDELKKKLDAQTGRMKENRQRSAEIYRYQSQAKRGIIF